MDAELTLPRLPKRSEQGHFTHGLKDLYLNNASTSPEEQGYVLHSLT